MKNWKSEKNVRNKNKPKANEIINNDEDCGSPRSTTTTDSKRSYH